MTPEHVAIIMDGNGRWARQRGKERIYGHYEGTESVRACAEYAAEAGIGYLSLFAFSEENWARPEAEVTELMRLMARSILDERLIRWNICAAADSGSTFANISWRTDGPCSLESWARRFRYSISPSFSVKSTS